MTPKIPRHGTAFPEVLGQLALPCGVGFYIPGDWKGHIGVQPIVFVDSWT